MANSIAKAKTYVENEQAYQKLFKDYALTRDLAKPFKGKGNGTVSVETVSLAAGDPAAYSEADGLTAMDITVAFVDHTPSHDVGNKLIIDRLSDEAAMGDNLVKAFNRYGRQKLNPYIDKSNLAAIKGTSGITTKTESAAATKSTVKAQVNAGIDSLVNAGVSAETPCIMYIGVSASRLLKDAISDAGRYQFDAWNGNVDNKVAVYGDSVKVKVVEIPDSLMPTKTQFLIVPVDAVDFVVANNETTLFTEIPGYGKRKVELDVNCVFDAWIKDEAKSLIYASVVPA